jgi:predicted methyltransferase
MLRIVLSYLQAESLLRARQAGEARAVGSLDLGLSTVEVCLETGGIRLADGQLLAWQDVEVICAAPRVCFLIEAGTPRKIQVYSEATNRLYSLMPTHGAPTMLVSGIPMHRIKGTDPHWDTLEKIKTIAPVRGQVLDTCTGLGYTAIQAAKTAERVVTVELDPAALEVARLNPWSRALFEDSSISQIVGDSFEVVGTLDSKAFARIIHDPPAFSLAGDLYSGEFYRELFRVLGRGGRLFHYIGDLESKSGRTVARGAARRLAEAGFSRVARRSNAFGLVAYK